MRVELAPTSAAVMRCRNTNVLVLSPAPWHRTVPETMFSAVAVGAAAWTFSAAPALLYAFWIHRPSPSASLSTYTACPLLPVAWKIAAEPVPTLIAFRAVPEPAFTDWTGAAPPPRVALSEPPTGP